MNEQLPQRVLNSGKKALLIVSFGTSHERTRALTIEAIERKAAATFTGYEVKRAFTSQMIIDKLARRDGLEIDTVEKGVKKLMRSGVTKLIVQPTHVLAGFEYEKMIAGIQPFEPYFDSVCYGKPLLTDEEDYKALVAVLTAANAVYDDGKTAVVLMGHGSGHPANKAYTILQAAFKNAGYNHYFIGAVEAKPDLTDVLKDVQATEARKVVLLPLMIVAGDHATNDMAADEEGSWKNVFENAGYEVQCVLKGLGEYEGIQKLFMEHIGDAIQDNRAFDKQ